MKRSPIKRKTALRKANPETAKNLRAYSIFRRVYLKHHPYCGVPGCFFHARDIHHKKGRGHHGSLLTYEPDLMAICRIHHDWIHSNTKAARQVGLLLT